MVAPLGHRADRRPGRAAQAVHQVGHAALRQRRGGAPRHLPRRRRAAAPRRAGAGRHAAARRGPRHPRAEGRGGGAPADPARRRGRARAEDPDPRAEGMVRGGRAPARGARPAAPDHPGREQRHHAGALPRPGGGALGRQQGGPAGRGRVDAGAPAGPLDRDRRRARRRARGPRRAGAGWAGWRNWSCCACCVASDDYRARAAHEVRREWFEEPLHRELFEALVADADVARRRPPRRGSRPRRRRCGASCGKPARR